MPRQQGWFALILALAIAAAAVCYNFPLQLGLDLKGGSQLTLEIQPTQEITSIKSDQVEAVKSVLDRRVNGLGVADSTLQTVGTNQLILELPGEQDPSKAARILGKTALLEFRAQKIGTEQQMRTLRNLRSILKSTLELKSLDDSSVINNGINESKIREAIKIYNIDTKNRLLYFLSF